MKKTDSSWGSHNSQNGKYILIDIATQPLLILRFLRPGSRAPLMIWTNICVCEGRIMHPTPTCKTTREVPKQIYHVIYPRVQYSSNDKKQHTYRRREAYIQKKGKINIQKTTLTFTYLIKIGLTLKHSPVESPSVATGVTTGTANKNNFILIFKTEESPP